MICTIVSHFFQAMLIDQTVCINVVFHCSFWTVPRYRFLGDGSLNKTA